MEKLGPGDNEHTLHVLYSLPRQPCGVIVDVGCGTGRQTIVLARELGSLIHAVDIYSFFLDELLGRAKAAGVAALIKVHCMNMQDVPSVFSSIELLWAEGSAYNIGFPNALKAWAPAVAPGGFVVVSEMCWLKKKVPAPVREFLASCYPGMQSIQKNIAAAEEAGYKLLGTYPIPLKAWLDGYYDLLAPRAAQLLRHPDSSVKSLAEEMLREIEIFNVSQGSYGYVFFILQRC